jgi:hypothetical protein
MGSRLYDSVRAVLSPRYHAAAELFDLDTLVARHLPERRPTADPAVKRIWAVYSFLVWAKLFDVRLD